MSQTKNYPSFREGKRLLEKTPKKGESMDTCATIHKTYVCCNVKVLKSVKNCPFDCSYCFLQDYLNDGTTQVVDDTAAMMKEVEEKTKKQPWRTFRIGTWELGDSLALEKETGQAKKLIEAFKTQTNSLLELKTKSDCVDTILDCDHRQKTVVSWSLNSQAIIDKEEHRTASLENRLKAIKKVNDAGYLIGLHFDPMIHHPEWEKGYSELIQAVFAQVNLKQVAWVSVGSLRFHPKMKQQMNLNFPKNSITTTEMVTGDDGKMRYIKPLRIEMYTVFLKELSKAIFKKDNLDPSLLSPLSSPKQTIPLIYFCMERWDIWEHFFGESPTGIGHLDYLFARNLKSRYPQLNLPEPSLETYVTYEHT